MTRFANESVYICDFFVLDKAGCRNKSKRSQINAIYFFIKVIGRGADEVAELAVQHYGLPYTGAEYLR